MLLLEAISEKILTIRGKKVILASDLAEVYGVATKALNHAVKRNSPKFPAEIAFQNTREEAKAAGRLRSQSVTLKRVNISITYRVFSPNMGPLWPQPC